MLEFFCWLFNLFFCPGRGRTAALATDVAPHWVGGLVDWGSRRVTAQAPRGEMIEVGQHYATFLTRLVEWTGSLNER